MSRVFTATSGLTQHAGTDLLGVSVEHHQVAGGGGSWHGLHAVALGLGGGVAAGGRDVNIQLVLVLDD
jgi:hypothetical protein